ncbi:putative eukaryotic translation initiation factor 5 [Venturia nashicola]|uniref:Putative eukaryotic translation initiation factor 5 n=1 Tax=Venturia nashicola TaxID=86259 RepID=A0A4Z1NVP5_9PEZI|nr:putative eukaryotic translation initiation factor 5 [Venturia nashicola]TLD21806.1 putative eukaryotic translation initiation factor 5 [Venturia nashicola]
MATVNIRRDVTDPFYRYKMEKIVSKIEGKGNGIKTVIPNLQSVANSLARPPNYVIKFFGFELGAQTNKDPKDDRWIINGAHDSSKLQDHLDGFINKFVLCKKCKNPETVVQIKDGRIMLDCKACGQRSEADPRLKLSGFIIKDQSGPKGKKDKATKKAARQAKKDAENGVNGSTNGNSPHDSNSDGASADGDYELDAGSDDELTKRINSEAKNIEDVDKNEIEWSVDTSAAAVAARAQELPDDLKRALVIDGEDGDEEGSAYDTFGNWITEQGEKEGGVTKLDNIEIYKKAQELGVEKKHRTLTVLAQTLFTEKIVKEIEPRAAILKKMITSEKHEKAFLGGLERFIASKPELIKLTSAILVVAYQEDLFQEETVQIWCAKASKKYVDLATSKKIRLSTKQFTEWLAQESEESEEESSEEE